MSKKPPKLTQELHQQIVAGIRAGGYAHVAAEAFGVPPTLFDDWLKRGSQPGAREPYASFAADAREAIAQARLKAEYTVFQDNPKEWLEHGPGRETPASVGWSAAVKAAESSNEALNVLLIAAVTDLVKLILKELETHPDLRERIADHIKNSPSAHFFSTSKDLSCRKKPQTPGPTSGTPPPANAA